MIPYERAIARLYEYEDAGYRAFHKKLLKTEGVNVIGVRTPILRKLAKEWQGEWERVLLFPDEYYEIGVIKRFLATKLPFERLLSVIDGLVDGIDNWATCDAFDCKVIANNREAFLPYLQKYLASEKEFTQRFALVTLLKSYMQREWLPLIFASVRNCSHGQYYTMMGAAWLLAEVLVKYYGEGLAFLQKGDLPAVLQNKAIQKARESFRLTNLQKETLKELRK